MVRFICRSKCHSSWSKWHGSAASFSSVFTDCGVVPYTYVRMYCMCGCMYMHTIHMYICRALVHTYIHTRAVRAEPVGRPVRAGWMSFCHMPRLVSSTHLAPANRKARSRGSMKLELTWRSGFKKTAIFASFLCDVGVFFFGWFSCLCRADALWLILSTRLAAAHFIAFGAVTLASALFFFFFFFFFCWRIRLPFVTPKAQTPAN